MLKISNLENLLNEAWKKLGEGEHYLMITSKKECLPIALHERSELAESLSAQLSAMFNKEEKAHNKIYSPADDIIVTAEYKWGFKYIGVGLGNYAIFGIFTNSKDTGIVKKILKNYTPKIKEVLDK